ncbi:protein of unknown function (plasmid) [Shinella sp. WSC3-e]|nr:protein of unknown function [Shinella sp. WSC3-e]
MLARREAGAAVDETDHSILMRPTDCR